MNNNNTPIYIGAIGGLACLFAMRYRFRMRKNPSSGFTEGKLDHTYKKGQTIIVNPKLFEKKVKMIFKDGGPDKLRVITDFDFTMSTFWFGGKRGLSCHSVIEECGLLPESYHTEARRLQNYYFPLEVSTEISFEEKLVYMVEWVEKAHEALVEFGFNQSMLETAVRKAEMELRDGVEEFLDQMEQNNIPVLIFSAGIANVLEEILKQKGHHDHKNVSVVSNRMVFDQKNGTLLGFEADLEGREPFHVFNKNYKAISAKEKEAHHSLWGDDNARSNVLLIGDSIGDTHMSDGIECTEEQILKVGFLNHHISERLEEYKARYDVLILNDGDFSSIQELVKDF